MSTKVITQKYHTTVSLSADTPGTELNKILRYAIKNQYTLKLDYYTRSTDSFSQGRKLDPYTLEGDYLTAYCHERQESRCFKTSRILKIKVLKATFEPIVATPTPNFIAPVALPIPIIPESSNTTDVFRLRVLGATLILLILTSLYATQKISAATITSMPAIIVQIILGYYFIKLNYKTSGFPVYFGAAAYFCFTMGTFAIIDLVINRSFKNFKYYLIPQIGLIAAYFVFSSLGLSIDT